MRLFLPHCCKTFRIAMMLRVFSPMNLTCLTRNQVVAGCEKLLRKVESSFTFWDNRISTCCVFYRPKVNLFTTSDVPFVNGVTPAQFYPIRSQYSRSLQQPNFLQDRFCCKTRFTAMFQNKLRVSDARFTVALKNSFL